MAANDISKEQYEIWVEEYKRFWNAFHTTRPLDREASMMYLMERMLLRIRLSVGLGDPGSNEKPQTPQEENLDPDGVRESD